LDSAENISYTQNTGITGDPLKDSHMDALSLPFFFALSGTIVVFFGGLLVYLEGLVGGEP
jgi:hypothetical protein